METNYPEDWSLRNVDLWEPGGNLPSHVHNNIILCCTSGGPRPISNWPLVIHVINIMY